MSPERYDSSLAAILGASLETATTRLLILVVVASAIITAVMMAIR